MTLTPQQKSEIIRELVGFLKDEPEIQRIVVFGSFLSSDAPNDLDVAVFQTSSEKYLPLAMKYRRKIDPLARRIAVDVIPLRPNPPKVAFLEEIARGEVVYERYPVGGALPDAEPDREQCRQCLTVAERVIQSVQQSLK